MALKVKAQEKLQKIGDTDGTGSDIVRRRVTTE